VSVDSVGRSQHRTYWHTNYYIPYNCRAAEFIVPGFVVGTSMVYSIVAVGHCCVPAAACAISGSGEAAVGCVTDVPSPGESLWNA
jgi:hypothetical protein